MASKDLANLAVVGVGPDGRIALSNSAPLDVVVDVVDYYTNAGDFDIWTYAYSPDGIRSTKSGPDTNITYKWDRASGLSMLLSETDANVATTYYIYGPGGLPIEQINADGSVYFIHHDQLGSTRMITNAAGNAIATFAYDAYGNESANSGTARTPFGFTGQYRDAESGYQYLRARYYDPSTGQFLTRDPIEALTRSAYGYVYGNPLNETDPSGLWAWDGYCIMGVNCGEDATYAVASPQDAADFAGGVLNGLALGHGAGITEALPFTRGKVDYDSKWATGGAVVGTAPWVVGSVGSSPAWAGASKATTGISITGRATIASAIINVWNACHTAGRTSDCRWSALTNAGTGALGAWGSIATAAGASLFSLFANYLDSATVRDFLLSRASADELC